MNFELIPLCEEHVREFKANMQKAFQQGVARMFGETEEEILPESHIDCSLSARGAAAYEAVANGSPVGGAIVVIDENTQHNHLDFLFVNVGVQNKGIGQAIWNTIEKLYPETRIWETCTPYFDKRNIHFYVNRCGFHIVEFYSQNHPDPNAPDEYAAKECHDSEYLEEMFRFEKRKT